MYVSGLCLGQPHQPSAFAAIEKIGSGNEAIFNLKELKRFRAGDPYPQTFDALEKWYKRPELKGTTLCVDRTGVGKGVTDLLHRRQIGAYLRLIQIIHGHHAAETEDGFSVPKKDLCGALQAVLETGRLNIPKRIFSGTLRTLRTELASFRVKNVTLGGDAAEEWRDSEQSDLVISTAISIWHLDRNWGPSWIPTNYPSQQSPMHRLLYGGGDEQNDRLRNDGLRPAR